MHGLDADAAVRRDIPRGTDVLAPDRPAAKADAAPMVDIDPIRRRRGKFVPIERRVGLRDDRPRMRMGRGFAGEVPGIELLEGGVDVVKVEHDGRDDPLVGVDLDDAEPLGADLAGRRAAVERQAASDEGKALPAGRNDGRRRGS